MKTVILLFIAYTLPAFAQFNCNREVNPQKVIIFSNLNNSYKEAEAAAKAACNRGEKFILFPSADIEYINKMNTTMLRRQELSGIIEANGSCITPINAENCKEFSDLSVKFYENSKIYPFKVEEFESLLNSLNASGAKIQSLIISGHSGGFGLQGTTGSLEYKTISKNIDKFPELFQDTKSIYLWGCYTGKSDKIAYWKSLLPSLHVLAGFDERAPLNTRTAGWNYLQDLLQKEADVIQINNDEEQLLSTLSKIKNINDTFASVYVKPCCDEEEFVYRVKQVTEMKPKDEHNFIEVKYNKGIIEHYDPIQACLALTYLDHQNNHKYKFNQYLAGELSIPEDTAAGNLRKIYNFSREFTICKTNFPNYADVLDADKVGLLLFFKGVQENFGHLFNEEALAAQNEIKNFNLEKELSEMSSVINDLESERFKFKNELLLLEKNKERDFSTVSQNGKNEKELLKENKTLLKKLPKDKRKAIELGLDIPLEGAELDLVTKYKENIRNLNSIQEVINSKKANISQRKQILRDEILKQTEKIDKLKAAKSVYVTQFNTAKQYIQFSTLEKPLDRKILNMSAKETKDWNNTRELFGTSLSQLKSFTSFRNHTQKYLIDLNSECMNFLEWHEYVPNEKPRLLCD